MRAPLLALPLLAACAELPAPEGPDMDALTWAWGDLHSHSNWSFDGCEVADALCTHAPDGPASGWQQGAVESGLDFAALTDHAESDLYEWGPDAVHAEGGVADVWEGQVATVLAAEGGPVLPILGYEWTANVTEDADQGPGSHRTVLFEDLDVCRGYRIGGRAFEDGEKAPDQGDRVYLQDQVPLVFTPPELWDALADAGMQEGCTPERWISFAHHPAYRVPQITSWVVEENRPLVETVVEIYSEHGSSECLAPNSEGCDWQVNEAQSYTPQGAVQTALEQGYVLGFVGGTDSHDAHPGSLHDEPSHIAQWDQDGNGPLQQFGPGGLTGAWIDGALDRTTLFDAIDARRTVATSGPRPALWAWAEGRSGQRYLAGQVIPRADLPATLHLEVGDLDPRGTLTDDQVGSLWIDQVLSGSGIHDQAEGDVYTGTWDPAPEDTWVYLRLRYERAGGEGLAEERVWISPWYTEARGCSSAPAPGGLLLLLPLLLRRRRR